MDGKILTKLQQYFADKVYQDIFHPAEAVIDKHVAEASSSIGAFIVREVAGKFFRQISFTVGLTYSDNWMEEALYGIIYKWNDIKRTGARLELTNKSGYTKGSMMYARLADGAHSLRYRKWKITIGIGSNSNPTLVTGKYRPIRTYIIMTTSMDPEFVEKFQEDLIEQRDAILKLASTGDTINVYEDYPEGKSVYWVQKDPLAKRRINTIYLPKKQMDMIVNTVNTFFSMKDEYKRLGIPWKLNILLYGKAGSGKTSIATMIASEWNRNLYRIGDGGKGGKSVPGAIICDAEDGVVNPVFEIEDIDRIPSLISEAKLEVTEKDDMTEERLGHSQTFRRFLSALDGMGGVEGRIVITTANDISKFSPILLRDGRFDLIMEIGYVNEEVFRKYVWNQYHKEIDHEFYMASDNTMIATMNQDVLKRYTYEEFLEKYTSLTPPEPKAKKVDEAAEEKIVEPKKKKRARIEKVAASDEEAVS